MAASTFSFLSDFGIQANTEPRITTAKFGDGYEQLVPDGLNIHPRRWNIKFTARTGVEADAIDDFFKDRNGGVDWFWWSPPRRGRIKVRCKTWNKIEQGFNNVDITAEFIECFDPGV
jgi:phage-related protein